MHWVHVHPQGENKKFGGLIWRGKLSGHPPWRVRSQIFEKIFTGRGEWESASG